MKNTIITSALLLLVAPFFTSSLVAQSNDSDRIENLEQQVETLQKTVKDLKNEDEEASSDSGSMLGDSLTFESDNGVFKGTVGGRLMVDYVFTDLDDSLQAPIEAATGDGDATDSSASFRRARLFAAGSYGDVGYKLQLDFAGGTSIKDAYLDFPSPLPGGYSVKVGRFYEPWGLEGQTSSKYITFMEFALPVDTFYAFRTNGIGAWGNALDKRMHWGASATRSTTDGFGDSQAEGEYAASGRLTGLPYIDEDGSHLLHTGVSATTRSVDNVRFGTDPELTDVASFVRTQNIDANRQTIGNVEAALILDSFSLQGEYIKNWISDNQTGLSDPSFDGFYAYASYWLTGEKRNYSKKTGKFGRPDVNDPVFEGGCGAWELVGRYSTLDLNDGGVTGGDISNITLGTNWWLNSHTKIAVNYVHSDVENGRNGADGNANMVGTRFQIDF